MAYVYGVSCTVVMASGHVGIVAAQGTLSNGCNAYNITIGGVNKCFPEQNLVYPTDGSIDQLGYIG